MLARVWRKGTPSALLLGKQTGTAALDNGVDPPQILATETIRSSNSISGYLPSMTPKGQPNRCPKHKPACSQSASQHVPPSPPGKQVSSPSDPPVASACPLGHAPTQPPGEQGWEASRRSTLPSYRWEDRGGRDLPKAPQQAGFLGHTETQRGSFHH